MATTPVSSSPPVSSYSQEPAYSGWILFAGIILITVGFLDVMYGLAAIINDKVIHVGGTGGVVIADFTTWGWVTLSIGALMALTGCGLLTGWGWARWAGIFFAGLNMLAQFGSISSFPLWALMIIALDVVIIYQLCTHWNPDRGT